MREAQRPTPLAIESAAGSRLLDADGNAYIDYVLGFGPILLGHRPQEVKRAVEEQLRRGVLFGAQHEGEVELAERLVELVPSAELVALSNSGSEAVHAALRFARVATGRTGVIKFEGHYHGWLDPIHVSGPATRPRPRSRTPVHAVPGLPAPADVLVCPWNDLDALRGMLTAHEGKIAAVIMEPVPCNFGNYEPLPGYLEGVRHVCEEHGVILIFDEVITGFRVALGGAQERYGVEPHLTVLGKAMASGFALSAVAGKAEIMAVAHVGGPVRHIGTYNGNAISAAAANATLEALARGGDGLYGRLESRSAQLADGFRDVARDLGAPLVVNQLGSVVHLLWDPRLPVRNHADACESDSTAVADIAAHLLGSGIFALERGLWFLSTAHTAEDVERTVAAVEPAIAAVLAAVGPRKRRRAAARLD